MEIKEETAVLKTVEMPVVEVTQANAMGINNGQIVKCVRCVSNGGFEDFITPGNDYVVLEKGVNGYYIETDKGVPTWLGDIHFVDAGAAVARLVPAAA